MNIQFELKIFSQILSQNSLYTVSVPCLIIALSTLKFIRKKKKMQNNKMKFKLKALKS